MQCTNNACLQEFVEDISSQVGHPMIGGGANTCSSARPQKQRLPQTGVPTRFWLRHDGLAIVLPYTVWIKRHNQQSSPSAVHSTDHAWGWYCPCNNNAALNHCVDGARRHGRLLTVDRSGRFGGHRNFGSSSESLHRNENETHQKAARDGTASQPSGELERINAPSKASGQTKQLTVAQKPLL